MVVSRLPLANSSPILGLQVHQSSSCCSLLDIGACRESQSQGSPQKKEGCKVLGRDLQYSGHIPAPLFTGCLQERIERRKDRLSNKCSNYIILIIVTIIIIIFRCLLDDRVISMPSQVFPETMWYPLDWMKARILPRQLSYKVLEPHQSHHLYWESLRAQWQEAMTILSTMLTLQRS